MNKLFTYLGYNKHPDYNREFAKYADALNPLVIKRHTILSLNPLDYLTMSFGNSWASCHTIDKENKRNMPNSYQGQYSSGTMSYMLDATSMVFYTVDKSYEGIEYWTQPKINRQMFHYAEDKLVQGRLYPQDNDGCQNEYTGYRNLVQEIIAQVLEVPNLWSLKIGTNAAGRYIYTRGTHYADYCYYDNCSLSTLKGSENEDLVYMFTSTSKITQAGSGTSVFITSERNMKHAMNYIGTQIISYDKLNRLRHAVFFKDADAIREHMKKHAEILRPRFEAVLSAFEKELGGRDIASWTKPTGGYFISLDMLAGSAKRVYTLCLEAGVKLTEAGATYPYGKDPKDANLRIAPSYPPLSELRRAAQVLCLCAKLAAVEKMLAESGFFSASVGNV
jgi:hypothetical protein